MIGRGRRLGDGLASGSAGGVVIAAASAVIGGAVAMLLYRQLRAPASRVSAGELVPRRLARRSAAPG